ncbi:excinuclease ABC subunit UvrC [Suttonella sp. R2A3]|uniref:excinuclease ABC subunit UvrC n=1 Tax=Suttonella sp. R2A3 TaxID=2908648 RepID=UPI001F167830|nr:excinuclease ABC subunit UvrC [Suttonella sp. R2A3]UJF24310.1 excinuclease ABC subunit UvrC [Suttonella sp. R2A3]
MNSKRRFDANVFLSHVSTLPGVYQMRDDEGKVLYVGKAKNLRKRLSSYFRSSGLSVKTQALMERVVDIDTTITQSETEALILEGNLIKAHRPRFNILLRDDKSYPYIHLSVHRFPRLSFHRGARKEGEYFGPYPNAQAARYAMDVLQKVFRVRQCEDSYFANRSRPCLQYQIERCYAPCVGYIDDEAYAETVRHTREFLNGRSERLLDELTQAMSEASEAQAYEQAAMLRDQLVELRKVTMKQHMVSGEADVDVLAVATAYGAACVQVMFYRDGHNVTAQAYFPKLPEASTPQDILSAFITQFYHQRRAPKQVLINTKLREAPVLAEFLSVQSEHKVSLTDKPRDTRRKWLEMAEDNAKQSLALKLAANMAMQQRFDALAEAFALDPTPERIECFDISHTQGAQTVASCVVFDQRGALKSDYRRYNIKDITPGDDFAAMRQVVSRRYSKMQATGDAAKRPDVVLIDGGKGQLRQAMDVFNDLGISDILLIGVAKGQGRKAGLEQFWFPDEPNPRMLPPDSQAMQLIVQIRDEAHRFAIGGHRQARAKQSRRSRLEQIPGIGAKRRQALLKYFGGLTMVEQASVDDLARVPGISATLAQEIYDSLHDQG